MSRLKRYLKEENKQVPITSLEQLYDALFARGELDPNKILEYAPYVKVDESKIKSAMKKLYKKSTDMTLSELYKKLERYGEVYNDIFGDRLAYTLVFENEEDIEEIFDFVDKQELDTFNRREKFAKDTGQISVKAWENMILNDFVTYLLKDEYSESSRQPIVDIKGIDSRTVIPEFLEYLNKRKKKEVKVTKG